MSVPGEADLGVVVSRETEARLQAFEDLVRKWTPRINLVSKSSLDEFHERHIRDSIQVFSLAPEGRLWADLGTGGGFPGLVCAILARELRPDLRMVLVESDRRKAAFLRTATQELSLDVEVAATRIENLGPRNADILTARALTGLTGLLHHANRHLACGGTALFPKGARWREEVAEARKAWSFRMEQHKSVTHPDAVILKIGDIEHV